MCKRYLAAVVQEDNLSLEHAPASRGRRVVAAVGEGAAAGRDVGGPTDAPERIIGGVRLLVEAADEASAATHCLGQRIEHLAAGGRDRREDLALDSVRRRQGCAARQFGRCTVMSTLGRT